MAIRQVVLAYRMEHIREAGRKVGLSEFQWVSHPECLHGLPRGLTIFYLPGWHRMRDSHIVAEMCKAGEHKLVKFPTPESMLLEKITNRLSPSLMASESFELNRGEMYTVCELLQDVCNDSDTLARLIREFREREKLGRKKYGTDVDRADLRRPDWHQHLHEELMDAALYSMRELLT